MAKKKSALQVNRGIEPPPSVNREAVQRLQGKSRHIASVEYYLQGIKDNNRAILSQAITLVESSLKAHRSLARQIITACLPLAGRSVRVGITGVPGVGKSTFIESFGKHLIAEGHRVAVLAIDPSSQRSKGSILGDKTRMEALSSHPSSFIRPSPSAGSLGGVAQKTYEAIILCEAAGYDMIIVETVGVGQSETEVSTMVDFFLLLMLAGAGDELQGIKRGIMEMSDAIIINKADGDNLDISKRAEREYANALHLFPPPPSGWTPRTGLCSALHQQGISEVWDMIKEYLSLTKNNGYFDKNRRNQEIHRLHNTLSKYLVEHFYGDARMQQELKKLEKAIAERQVDVYSAAEQLSALYFSKKAGD